MNQNQSQPRGADAPEAPSRPPCTAADLFAQLWQTLVETVGPVATATLLERSIKRAAAAQVDVEGVVIRREQFVYSYSVPASWHDAAAPSIEQLRRIVAELLVVLKELTGTVIIRRLGEVPDLIRCGVLSEAAWR
jgi:hypothetical protein